MYHENVKDIYVRGRSGEVANRVAAERFENSKFVKPATLREFNGAFFNICFYYATNFLIHNEYMLLKFFSFTFMKIEQNCIFFPIHLNGADLHGNIQQ